MYLLPTIELVERLKRAIDGRRAIEIGSGNGVLAEALGIQGTDNFMQEMPKYKALYAAQGQPTIKYGKNVENLDALAAIKKYKPDFEMVYDVDPLKQSIAESWPDRLDDTCAREEWDWCPRYDLDAMTRDMLEKLAIKLGV